MAAAVDFPGSNWSSARQQGPKMLLACTPSPTGTALFPAGNSTMPRLKRSFAPVASSSRSFRPYPNAGVRRPGGCHATDSTTRSIFAAIRCGKWTIGDPRGSNGRSQSGVGEAGGVKVFALNASPAIASRPCDCGIIPMALWHTVRHCGVAGHNLHLTCGGCFLPLRSPCSPLKVEPSHLAGHSCSAFFCRPAHLRR
jgi:hypothetical protein